VEKNRSGRGDDGADSGLSIVPKDLKRIASAEKDESAKK